MQFIRQNVFMVSLIATFVLLAACLLVANLSIAGKVKDELVAPRDSLQATMNSFSGKSISLQQIAELESRVKMMQTMVQDLANQSSQWNRRNYQVIQMEANVGGNSQKVASFPIERQYVENGSLFLNFIETYRNELNSLLTPTYLNATSFANPAEVDKKIREETERITAENERAAAARAKAGAEGGGGAPAAAPARVAPAMPGMPGAAGTVSGDVAALAKQSAFKHFMLLQARKGEIYATPDSLDFVFAGPAAVSAPYDKLWEAQLNLWVQKDIINAIRETNREVGDKDVNVLTAAVKRLVKIDVDEQYFVTGRAGGAAPVTNAPSAAPVMPGAVPGMGRPGGMMPGMPGMPGRAPLAGGGQAPAAGVARAASGDINFTQRSSCKDYDVIHYSFTVVMPTRYVTALERNLMRQNYHTIIKVDMAPVSVDPNAASANVTVPPLYYGSDPVMEVTFQGELLLLTSWERGTLDTTTNKWTLPPLMPAQVLKSQLQAFSQDLLRPEDLVRISESRNP